MKEYTAEDCIKDEYNDNGSRSLYFNCEEDSNSEYEVTIESVTLHLSEEIEKQGGGLVKEFAALMLNKHLTEAKELKNTREFFEDIST